MFVSVSVRDRKIERDSGRLSGIRYEEGLGSLCAKERNTETETLFG